MRILTVRQPWAWAIIHGGKDVENRTRDIAGDYRGPVAIHAGLANDIDAWTALGRLDLAAYSKALDARESLFNGAIIGVVDLVDVHACKSHSGGLDVPVCFDDTPTGRTCSHWADFRPGERIYHLRLADPRRLVEPILFRGGLGLRTLGAELAGRIEREAVRP